MDGGTKKQYYPSKACKDAKKKWLQSSRQWELQSNVYMHISTFTNLLLRQNVQTIMDIGWFSVSLNHHGSQILFNEQNTNSERQLLQAAPKIKRKS